MLAAQRNKDILARRAEAALVAQRNKAILVALPLLMDSVTRIGERATAVDRSPVIFFCSTEP